MKKTGTAWGLWITAVVFMVACSSSQKKQATEFQLKPVEEKTLPNGLKVLYIKDKSLPRLSFTLFLPKGSAQDPAGQEGLAALTVSLLDQGSKARTALQTADAFAQLGSSFAEGVSHDYTMLSTTGLSKYQKELLELFAQTVLTPVFSPAEIERKRSQILADLLEVQDNPQSFADELLERENFQSHPYANPVSGKISSVKKLTRTQIQAQYQKYFRPNFAWLAIAGNYDGELMSQVERSFGAWQNQEPPKELAQSLPVSGAKSIKLFSKAGLQQTQIRIGQIGLSRNHPDFLKLRLANIVLGGAFASRLNQKVRDDLGLTYSISSASETKKQTGSFEISTFSRNEKVGETIKQTFLVTQEFEKNGITQKELDAAKALLIGQFPAAIETVDRLAFNLLILRLNEIPETYLTQFFSNVNAITLKEVNDVIKKHVRTDSFKTIVFADATLVQDQLKALEPIAGPLTVENIKTAEQIK